MWTEDADKAVGRGRGLWAVGRGPWIMECVEGPEGLDSLESHGDE